MKLLDRIRRAFSRSESSSDPIVGGTAGTQVGIGRIEAAERNEFAPEEFASDEQEESR